NQKIMLVDLRRVLQSDEIGFAAEEEFKSRFPDCEIGAMPPNSTWICDPPLILSILNGGAVSLMPAAFEPSPEEVIQSRPARQSRESKVARAARLLQKGIIVPDDINASFHPNFLKPARS
ncbi:MAG: hypothetical protein M1608_01560, partial [Candidatus Omnitrophica bacterium]|nr:hypothetical protein [Candidatus Omnitrophota bacterium]